MKKGYVVLCVVVAAGLAGNILLATLGYSAEAPETKHLDASAAMRVDVTPLVEKLDRLEQELTQIRTAMQEMGASIDAMQEKVDEAATAMSTLKRPERWVYQILRNTSSRAADQLGEEGWELVGGSDTTMFFRKPAPESDLP